MQQKREKLPARHELKYFVNEGELEVLRRRLLPVMRLDSHCIGGEPYAIRSLYFDDVDDSAWYDKQAGVMHRDKYRIRIYNYSDAEIFLERKRKMGDLIQKSSAKITRRLCDQLVSGDPAGLYKSNTPLLQDMYVQMRTKLLRPRVIVDYLREAYVHPAENTRITFDLDLRSGMYSRDLFDPDLPTVCPHDRNVQIMEVKFDNYLPAHIAGMLSGISAERSAISKYVMCRRYEPLNG